MIFTPYCAHCGAYIENSRDIACECEEVSHD